MYQLQIEADLIFMALLAAERRTTTVSLQAGKGSLPFGMDVYYVNDLL